MDTHGIAAPRRVLPGWLAPAIAASLALLQLAAFRWGVVTPDTVWQYQQALAGAYDDWHPPVTAALWRALGAARFGGAPLLLLNVTLYWGGVLALAEAPRRRGSMAGVAAVLLLAALPIPFGQMGALLKDPLLAAACLAAAGLLALREMGAARSWPAAAGALALLLLASAVRINALFATAPLLALLAPAGWRVGWRRPAALATAALVAAAANWAIDVALLQPHRSRPILSLVNFDLGGIVAEGGGNFYPQLDDRAAARLTARCYRVDLYNPAASAACDAVEDGLAQAIDEAAASPARHWLSAVAASPGAWLRHRIGHLNRNWRFLVAGVPRDAVYMMSQPNTEGLSFSPNWLTVAIVRAAEWLAWSPLGRPATWAAAALGLLLAGARRANPLAGALAWSALLYAGGYALVSVAPDLRYNLWTLLAAGTAASIAVPLLPRRARRIALVPPIVAMAAEATALILG